MWTGVFPQSMCPLFMKMGIHEDSDNYPGSILQIAFEQLSKLNNLFFLPEQIKIGKQKHVVPSVSSQ